jgi:hypothetical protein
MKRVFSIVAVATVAAGTMFVANSCGSDEPITTTGAVTGNIYDDITSNPLGNVEVDLKSQGAGEVTSLNKLSDNNGSYLFNDVSAGTYAMTFHKAGYVNASRTITVGAGQTSPGDVHLMKAALSMSVLPTSLTFSADKDLLALDVKNTAPSTVLAWQVEADKAWISLSPTNGETTNETDVVKVTVDRTQITSYPAKGSVMFTSDAGSLSVDVTVNGSNN